MNGWVTSLCASLVTKQAQTPSLIPETIMNENNLNEIFHLIFNILSLNSLKKFTSFMSCHPKCYSPTYEAVR